MAMTNSPLMTLPNRRIASEKCRVISDSRLSGSMKRLGLGETGQVAAQPLGADAEAMDRDEDHQGQGSRGLQLAGGGLDAGDQARQIAGQQQQKHACPAAAGRDAGLCAARPRSGSCSRPTTISSTACTRPGCGQAEASCGLPTEQGQPGHDHPSGDHRAGDDHRADGEKFEADQGRGHGAASLFRRRAMKRATTKPASPTTAPPRPTAPPAIAAGRPGSAGPGSGRRQGCGSLAAAARARCASGHRNIPARRPARADQRQQGSGIGGHGRCILFQASQQPSTSPPIIRLQVQKIGDWKGRRGPASARRRCPAEWG